MATVGDILDEFFSPLSSEKMWVMPANDKYTRVVRKWVPVINSTNRIKLNLMTDCATWNSYYKSTPGWKPSKTDAPKVGAYRDFVASPPGTDPTTCKSAFIAYMASKSLGLINPLAPEIQTKNLYTCSIGSFNIYATVDAIDCANKTATINYWMYNSMSKKSFGKFANYAVFALCGMKTQYMWWNWGENVDWSSGMMQVIPPKTPANAGW